MAEGNLIGKIAICSIGYIGLIQDHVKMPWGWSWVGIKLADGSSWASRDPYIIADSVREYNQKKAEMNEADWAAIEESWQTYMASKYGECKYQLERGV